MASLENKYGKSAVDATRRNALPPYLDTLFEGGIGGGGGVETYSVTLQSWDWDSNLQQNVVLTCGATNASDIICAGDNTSMEADYYLGQYGIKLTNVSIVEGEEEGINTATFTFTATRSPGMEVDVVIIIINFEGSTGRVYNIQQILSYAQTYGPDNIFVAGTSPPAIVGVADEITGLQAHLRIDSNRQNHGIYSTGYVTTSTGAQTADGRWLIRRGSSGAAATDCTSFYINGNKASVASMSLSGTTLTITDPSA